MSLEDLERRRITRRQKGSQTQSIIQTGEFVGTDPGSGLPIVQSIDGSRFRGRSITNQPFEIGDPIQITSVNGGQLSRVDRIPEIRNRQQFVPFEQGDPFIPDRRRNGFALTLTVCQSIFENGILFEDEDALCGFGLRSNIDGLTFLLWVVEVFPANTTSLSIEVSARTPTISQSLLQIYNGISVPPSGAPITTTNFFVPMPIETSWGLTSVSLPAILTRGMTYTFVIFPNLLVEEWDYIRITQGVNI
jgi:hypothetical protein